MNVLIMILIATFLVSLVSLIGVFFLIFNKNFIQKYTILLVALAAGTLLGGAFIHLIPESFELYNESLLLSPSYFILFGILLFYFIEKVVHWHHHHDIDCKNHSLSTLSIIGDGVHNFIDGSLIAISFMADFKLGIITTITIILHEVPQELGDFAILIHSGFSNFKALFFNFLSGLTSIFGALLSYFFLSKVEVALPLMLAFTAGGFIYISLADIIPELHSKKYHLKHGLITSVFLLGIILTYMMSLFF